MNLEQHQASLGRSPNEAAMTLLPQIHAEIREEFRTSSGPSNSSGNPPPVTIHTWLERFNKQKPHSFKKVTAPVDAENWISHMEKIFDVMGYEDAFKTRLVVYKFEGNALAWWKAYKQAKDVAQVANDARNYEILHERDDDDAERPDKRQKSGDRHQPTSQQSSHRNHGHNNDRQGSDRRGGGDNHRSSNNNNSGNNNRNSGNGRDQRNRGQQSNRPANSGFQQSRGPSEAYSYP
nr:zinc finger, CCHC-type, retrotransposon Gag domain protein [Tanacetum cinerariifolium]